MANWPDLQHRVFVWHHKHWPNATIAEMGLKLGEEAGEAQRGLIRRIEGRAGGSREELAEEFGDAAICLMRLCSEFGLDFDTVVAERVEIVTTRPMEPMTNG